MTNKEKIVFKNGDKMRFDKDLLIFSFLLGEEKRTLASSYCMKYSGWSDSFSNRFASSCMLSLIFWMAADSF